VRPGPVAFFLPSLCYGGAERVAINLARGFAERGVATDLVVVNARGEFAAEIPPGVRLVDLRASRVILGLPALASYMRREHPAAVISFMDHAGIVALWARRVSGTSTPIICTAHTTLAQATLNSSKLRNRLLPALVRASYPSADEVVAVSHGVARGISQASGLPLSRIRVIYNPVISAEFLAHAQERPDHPWLAPGQPPVILAVGRLAPAKDFATLIKAFAEVVRSRPARLLILGEGEERTALAALAAELGVAEHVGMPGFRENATAYMAAAAVFVLSSAWEGLPTVLIEALAAGTRVVSTDCPSGPREILQDGRLGPLVPVGDAPALAQAIVQTLDQPLGVLPADALAPFTREAAIDNYLQMLEQA
jgi:glycosyltransferase involved in cell wall biosynthesis